MSNKTSRPSTGKPMTTTAAARIQSANAKVNGGITSKGGFVARAQRAAAKTSKK